MNVKIVSEASLALSFIPVLIVIAVFVKWQLNYKELLYACIRMLAQLVTIGYFLNYLFNNDNWWWAFAAVLFMLVPANNAFNLGLYMPVGFIF